MKKFLAVLMTAVLFLGVVSAAAGEASLQQVYQYTAGGGADLLNGTSILELGGYGQLALASLDGTLLSDSVYSYFSYDKGLFTATAAATGSYGVLNMDGQVVVPCEYDDIRILSEYWVAAVKINRNGTEEDHDYVIFGGTGGKYGLIDSVDLYNVKGDGLMATLTRDHYTQAGAQGEYLNVYDRETDTVHQYDGAYQLLGDTDYIFRYPGEEAADPYATFYEDGKYGLKDSEGNVLVPAQFDYIQGVQDGFVKVKNGDCYGACDLSGNIVVPVEYDGFEYTYGTTPTTFTEDPFTVFGYVAVKKDDKIGYWSLTEGSMTAEPRYGTAERANSYGISQLIKTEDGFVLYAADGTEAKLEGFQSCYHLDPSMGRYFRVQDEKYKTGLVDWHGNEVLPCSYSDIRLSGDGLYLMTYESETDTVTVYELSDEFVPGN